MDKKRLAIIRCIDQKKKYKAMKDFLRVECKGKTYDFCEEVIVQKQIKDPDSVFNQYCCTFKSIEPKPINQDCVQLTEAQSLEMETDIIMGTISEIYPKWDNGDGICQNEFTGWDLIERY